MQLVDDQHRGEDSNLQHLRDKLSVVRARQGAGAVREDVIVYP